MEKLLATGDVAERLGMTRSAVKYRCLQGFFPNAQQVGGHGMWVIPEGDLEGALPPKRGRPRKKLTRGEYEARDLVVLAFWKRRPPRLRCPECDETWRAWDWQCPNECNSHHPPAGHAAANSALRDAREQAGLTQRVLAERVGVAVKTVSRWEQRGAVPATAERRRKVHELLGVDARPEMDGESD